MKKYKLAIGIGRFQPFHKGHEAFVDHGFNIADNVALFIGSHNAPPDIQNPFPSNLRANLITSIYADKGLHHRLEINPLEDRKYNDTYWMRAIQQEIYAKGLKDSEICLLGWKKDNATARYLEWFPQWKFEELEKPSIINATDIRNMYWSEAPGSDPTKWVRKNHIDYENLPGRTARFLETYAHTREYDYIMDWFRFQREHDKMYAGLKYKPTFVTVDAVVLCAGHILMVKRRAHPGKGLWALPGGYLNVEERVIDGSVRELLEETKIKLPEPVLRGSIEHVQCFDDPKRSTRGRILTHAVKYNLGKNGPLPKVKGADDAEKAIWMPFAALDRRVIFEDHLDISHIMASNTVAGDRR